MKIYIESSVINFVFALDDIERANIIYIDKKFPPVLNWWKFPSGLVNWQNIFDDEIYREGMRTLLLGATYEYEIPVGEIKAY